MREPGARIGEDVVSPEEWETDPFGEAASIIREAVEKALSYQGAMSDEEAEALTQARTLTD